MLNPFVSSERLCESRNAILLEPTPPSFDPAFAPSELWRTGWTFTPELWRRVRMSGRTRLLPSENRGTWRRLGSERVVL